jgi:hypothetical protein
MKKTKLKLPKEFVCVKCDYKCGYPSQYIRHLGTVKHNKTEIEQFKQTETNNNNKLYLCVCGTECEGISVLREHVDMCKNKDQFMDYMQSCDCVPGEMSNGSNPIKDEFRRLMLQAIYFNQ